MALQSRVVNGSLTEIYAGGGNFVTEAFPTNFHTFAPKRILLNGQSADDYKEVTPAERSAIEAADAKWIEPSQTFIDTWLALGKYNNTQVSGYNEDTGLFWLADDVSDLMPYEALEIATIAMSMRHMIRNADGLLYVAQPGTTRAFFPIQIDGLGTASMNKFMRGQSVEKIRFYSSWEGLGGRIRVSSMLAAFSYCANLRVIDGNFDISGITNANLVFEIFYRCERLEEFRLTGLKVNIGFPQNRAISYASMEYLISNAANSNAITITVHPDVYAKLTDESNADWHALMASAAAKNITFATT